VRDTLRRLTAAGRLLGYRAPALLAAFALGAALYLSKPLPIERAALAVDDLKLSVAEFLAGSDPVPGVLIVAVDAASLKEFGAWPWSSAVLARLFNGLREARLVALDLGLSGREDGREGAEELARALAGGNFLPGYRLHDKATARTVDVAPDLLRDSAYNFYEVKAPLVGLPEFEFLEPNLPEFERHGLAAGFVNLAPDVDGVYRSYPLAYVHDGAILPSLAVQVAQHQLESNARLVLDGSGVRAFDLGGVRITGSNFLRLRFGDPSRVPSFAAETVLKGTLPPAYFRGKVVLVGVTDKAVQDVRPTALDPESPPVFLHYAAVSNLLENRLVTTSWWGDLALLGGACLLTALASHRKRRFSRVTFFLGGLVLAYAASAYLFAAFDLHLRESYALVAAAVLFGGLEFAAFVTPRLRAEEVKEAFAPVVSREVLRELAARGEELQLGGEEREVSVLFAGIQYFPYVAEMLSASQRVALIREVHEPLTRLILEHGGLLEKYVEDAAFSVFNAPQPLEVHADHAAACALEANRELETLNRRLGELGLPPVRLGMGVSTGSCVVGNIGSSVRFHYSASGEAVGLAERLGRLCGTYRVPILATEFSWERFSGGQFGRKIDRVRTRGREKPVWIYHVMEDTRENRFLRERYEEALELYLRRAFQAAEALFLLIAEESGDGPARIFANRCTLYRREPPQPGWDGVFAAKAAGASSS
jgi:adenylate cyclase